MQTSSRKSKATQASTEEPTAAPADKPTSTPTEEPTVTSTEEPAVNLGDENNTKPVDTTHTHSYSVATCTQPKKCSCGAIEGKALGHKWTNANCTTPKTCSVCKATEGNATGHNWSVATCVAAKTCTKCGATEGGVAEHKWTEATCAAPKTCSGCKKTEGTVVDHSFDTDGKCKFCKQILPVNPENIKNRTYSLYKYCTTLGMSDEETPPAIYCVGLMFETGVFFHPGECIEGDYARTHGYDMSFDEPIYYEGRDYYPWVGGFGGIFTSRIAGNHIVVTRGESVLELELLSNDTLRVVSQSNSYRIAVGDIFI